MIDREAMGRVANVERARCAVAKIEPEEGVVGLLVFERMLAEYDELKKANEHLEKQLGWFKLTTKEKHEAQSKWADKVREMERK